MVPRHVQLQANHEHKIHHLFPNLGRRTNQHGNVYIQSSRIISAYKIKLQSFKRQALCFETRKRGRFVRHAFVSKRVHTPSEKRRIRLRPTPHPREGGRDKTNLHRLHTARLRIQQTSHEMAHLNVSGSNCCVAHATNHMVMEIKCCHAPAQESVFISKFREAHQSTWKCIYTIFKNYIRVQNKTSVIQKASALF